MNDFHSGFTLAPEVKPVVATSNWSINDYLGSVKVRFAINRDNYKVKPGLYSVGFPGDESEIFVSANYKLSFDILRKNLNGTDAWILVLDTKGINVWCAAGKGTFGTSELVNKINETLIAHRVNHRRIIVPQLGAPGIASHEVKLQTGFNVKYGPVRALDIQEFIDNKYNATREMRRVTFDFFDRLKLIPVEWIFSFKYMLICMLIFITGSGFTGKEYSVSNLQTVGVITALHIFMAFFSGTTLGPLLLPVLPFRGFSLKGAFAGLLTFIAALILTGQWQISVYNLSMLLIYLAAGSFFTMNFTGASTYTSLSGVKKEMKYAVPAQLIALGSGFLLFVLSRFIQL